MSRNENEFESPSQQFQPGQLQQPGQSDFGLQQAQPGLEFIFTDEIPDQEYGNDPNQTANDRIDRGLNMMASFVGSVYYWHPQKNKWTCRHATYSSQVLYIAKGMHTTATPLVQFDCKRQPISIISDPVETDPDSQKCIMIGEFEQSSKRTPNVSDQIEMVLSGLTVSSSNSAARKDEVDTDPNLVAFSRSVAKACIFKSLADNEVDLWLASLNNKTTEEQNLKPIFNPDPVYRLIQIKYMALNIARAPRLEQELRIAAIRRNIQTTQNWIKELQASGNAISDKQFHLRELEEELEIMSFAVSHPNSPVDKRRYDIDSAEKQLYMEELKKRQALGHDEPVQKNVSIIPDAAALEAIVRQTALTHEQARSFLESGTQESQFAGIMSQFTNMINPDDLTIDWTHTLDSTAFATQHPGRLRVLNDIPIDVAVKVPNKAVKMDLQRRQSLLREVITLRQVMNPNIIRFYGVVQIANVFAILTERVAGEDMASVLTKNRIPQHWATILLKDVASGMDYLHRVHGIKHRDLKPRNILIAALRDNMLTAKISEFGMVSTPVPSRGNPNQTLRPYYGTPSYAAPELPELTHTTAVDVFSFAYVMWQMHYRYTPFYKDQGDMSRHLEDVKDNNKRERLGPECIWYPLVERCWQTEPQDRPTFKEVKFYLETLEDMFDTHPNDPKSQLDKGEHQKWITMVSGKSFPVAPGQREPRIPTPEEIRSLMTNLVDPSEIQIVQRQ